MASSNRSNAKILISPLASVSIRVAVVRETPARFLAYSTQHKFCLALVSAYAKNIAHEIQEQHLSYPVLIDKKQLAPESFVAPKHHIQSLLVDLMLRSHRQRMSRNDHVGSRLYSYCRKPNLFEYQQGTILVQDSFPAPNSFPSFQF